MTNQLEFARNSTTTLLKTSCSRKVLIGHLKQEKNVNILYGEHLTLDEQFLLTALDAVHERPDT